MSKSTSSDKGIEQGYRDPVVEAYKRDVDRSLLRENLSKTPEQRVVALMRLQALARARPSKQGSSCVKVDGRHRRADAHGAARTQTRLLP